MKSGWIFKDNDSFVICVEHSDEPSLDMFCSRDFMHEFFAVTIEDM